MSKGEPTCGIWITERPYCDPGPCENKRQIQPTKIRGKKIVACRIHRVMIEAGRPVTLTSEVNLSSLRPSSRYSRRGCGV